MYHPHQSRGLRPKQVTLIRPRCPVTGQLLGPGEGRVFVLEHVSPKLLKPIGKRSSMRVAVTHRQF